MNNTSDTNQNFDLDEEELQKLIEQLPKILEELEEFAVNSQTVVPPNDK